MKLTGWTRSVTTFIAGSALVFAANLGVLLWATASVHHVANDGSYILHEADTSEACAKQKSLNTWLHLLINIFSTVILSGSNYCMQCLSAPTRADVNKAHCRGRYLDIGVSNLRNLMPFTSLRAWLWLALGVSSLPLHLFYNSAVYRSTSANNYAVFSVGPNFVTSDPLTNLSLLHNLGRSLAVPDAINPLGTPRYEMSEIVNKVQDEAASNKLVRLDPVQCISSYVQTFQSEFRNLILVTDNATDAVDYVEPRFWRDFMCNNRQAYAWACGYAQPQKRTSYCVTECDQKDMMARITSDAQAGNWSPLGNRVQYCLAERTEARCQLQFNLSIAITVVVLNAVKMVLMAIVLFVAFRGGQYPLLSTGDAVKSFLTNPDPTTRFQCLLSSRRARLLRDAVKTPGADEYTLINNDIWRPLPRHYRPQRGRWGSAVRFRRWFMSILLYAIALGTASGYLGLGISSLTGPKDLASIWRMGIGSVSNGSGSGKAIVFSQDQLDLQGAALLLKMVILANIPQLILSLLYFSYNAIFTIMLSAAEWSDFAIERKGLRICATKPVGKQRDSYWLQLPYRWSVPLIAFSVLLHWLVSQSIFLVNVNFINSRGETYNDRANDVGHLLSLGYSPLAILAVIVVGVILIVFIVGLASFRKFASGMPVVANNSVAISAACHTITRHLGANMASRELQWGETGEWDESDLAHARAVLRESDEGMEMMRMNPRPKLEPHASTNSRVNLLGAEYLRVDISEYEDPMMQRTGEYTLLSGLEYWHCGFTSEMVDPPDERKLYL